MKRTEGFQLDVDMFPKPTEAKYRKLMLQYAECRITKVVADEYQRMAMDKDFEERWQLRNELMQKYGVTELEAINILNGFHVNDYVNKYELISQGIFFNVPGAKKREEDEFDANSALKKQKKERKRNEENMDDYY